MDREARGDPTGFEVRRLSFGGLACDPRSTFQRHVGYSKGIELMQRLAKAEIIYADGRRESHEVNRRILLNWCQRMIGAETIDTVNLHDGRIMLVDDVGLVDGKPINPEATKLYHSVCRPGTTNPIAGDVAVCWDKDFE